MAELLGGLREPPVVVGSSMGGLVAAAAARQGAPMARLILLAPAFGFARRRLSGRRWAGYRRRGTMPTYHHARGRWLTLGPELLADLPRWRDDDQWRLDLPVAILHGRRDDAVPLAESQAFAARQPGRDAAGCWMTTTGCWPRLRWRHWTTLLAEAFRA